MGAIPPPKSCGPYLPGHEVHWIQSIHSHDRGEVPPVPCRVLEVADDGTTVVDVEGRRLELWTHDPVRLLAILDEHRDAVSYQPGWRLLRIPYRTKETGLQSAYCIDVAPASSPERRPCPSEPPRHGTPVRQLVEAGGITLSGSEVRRWLRERRTQTDGAGDPGPLTHPVCNLGAR